MAKLTININASSLRDSSCLLNWYRTIVDGYTEPRFNCKIVYGIALHKFLQLMYQTGDIAKAKDEALKVFRQPKVQLETEPDWYLNEQHFMWACFDTWTNYAATDGEFQLFTNPKGEPAVEQTFSILFYEDDTIRVNLCGTIDKIGRIKGGVNCIGDWKSTGTPPYKQKEYLADFDMRSQLRFYILGLKLMNRHFPDSQLGTIGAGRLGAFIDAIFLTEKPADIKVKRSSMFLFTDDDIDAFEKSLMKRIVQLSHAIADGSVALREGIVLNTCEKKYYKCSFFTVCRTGNPKLEEMLLKRNFVQREYDPLHRDKI